MVCSQFDQFRDCGCRICAERGQSVRADSSDCSRVVAETQFVVPSPRNNRPQLLLEDKVPCSDQIEQERNAIGSDLTNGEFSLLAGSTVCPTPMILAVLLRPLRQRFALVGRLPS
jgi:hypothetical protein